MENIFEQLPFVTHVRELKKITGGAEKIGWMCDDNAFLLYAIVKWFKPELTVHTGHLWGKSASMVLEALNDGFLGRGGAIELEKQEADKIFNKFFEANKPELPQETKFLSIDPRPRGMRDSHDGIRYLRGLHQNFEFYEMKSSDFFLAHGTRLQKEFAGSRILGVVDGDHTWFGCMSDLHHLARIGAQFIFVDDTTWLPHLSRAAKAFARREHYQCIDLTLYNGTGILYKDSYFIGPPSGKVFRAPPLQELFYSVGGMRLLNFVKRAKGFLRRSIGIGV